MFLLDPIVRLYHTIQLNSTKRRTAQTAEAATREVAAGSFAFMFLVAAMNVIYQVPFVRDAVGTEREQATTVGIIVVLLLSSGFVYYLIFSHYTNDRLEKLYKPNTSIDPTTAKILYALWFVFYICFILIAAFMTIFSAL